MQPGPHTHCPFITVKRPGLYACALGGRELWEGQEMGSWALGDPFLHALPSPQVAGLLRGPRDVLGHSCQSDKHFSVKILLVMIVLGKDMLRQAA